MHLSKGRLRTTRLCTKLRLAPVLPEVYSPLSHVPLLYLQYLALYLVQENKSTYSWSVGTKLQARLARTAFPRYDYVHQLSYQKHLPSRSRRLSSYKGHSNFTTELALDSRHYGRSTFHFRPRLTALVYGVISLDLTDMFLWSFTMYSSRLQ